MAESVAEIQKSAKEKSIHLKKNYSREDNPSKDPIVYDISPKEICPSPVACCYDSDMLLSKQISLRQSRNQVSARTDKLPKRDLLNLSYYIIPETTPSPFEIAIWNVPNIVTLFLSYLGDPVARSSTLSTKWSCASACNPSMQSMDSSFYKFWHNNVSPTSLNYVVVLGLII